MGADEPDGTGHEGEGDDERQRAVTDPIGGEWGADTGGETGGDGRAVALLGDLAEVLPRRQGEDHDDDRQDDDRAGEQGDDERRGDDEPGDDRVAHVARRHG